MAKVYSQAWSIPASLLILKALYWIWCALSLWGFGLSWDSIACVPPVLIGQCHQKAQEDPEGDSATGEPQAECERVLHPFSTSCISSGHLSPSPSHLKNLS